MRIKTLIVSLCFLLVGQVFASDHSSNVHAYPKEKNLSANSSVTEKEKLSPSFGSCEVEIINDSFSNVTVYGRYDDGIPLTPFNVYSYEFSHYIDLYYNGYCHSGIYLSIVTFSGYTIFSGWVYVGSTVHIVPLVGNKLKANIEQPKAVA